MRDEPDGQCAAQSRGHVGEVLVDEPGHALILPRPWSASVVAVSAWASS